MKLQNSSDDCEGKAKCQKGDSTSSDKWANEARVLSESIKCMQQFSGETFVIKYDGSAMTNKDLAESFASDIVLLKQVGINPIIVHGGNHRVEEILEKLGRKDGVFVNDLRVMDCDTLEVAEMVLSGLVNKDVVQIINDAGGYAVGISGKDAGLVEARKMCLTARDGEPNNVEKIMDVGFMGEPNGVSADLLFFFEESDFVPVISPVCLGANKVTYVVNPDIMAGAIASAVSASKLVIFSESDFSWVKASNENMPEVSVDRAEKLIGDGRVSAELERQLQTCVKFARETCGTAHIVNGNRPYVLLAELFTACSDGIRVCCEFDRDS